MNVYALMCTCVQAPVSTLGVFHYSSPLYYLRQNLSLELEVANSARVAGQCASGYSAHPGLGFQHTLLCLVFIWVLGIQFWVLMLKLRAAEPEPHF